MAWQFLALILAFWVSTCFADSCLETVPAGFRYVNSTNGTENYVSEKKDLSLTVKCFGKGQGLKDVKVKLGRELEFRRLDDRIEYFDLNRDGVVTRTYLVDRADRLDQLTFVTDVHLIRSIQTLNERVLSWLKK